MMNNLPIQDNTNMTIPQQKSDMDIVEPSNLENEKQDELKERTFGGVDIKQELMDTLMKLVF